jgi:hypothetical protein
MAKIFISYHRPSRDAVQELVQDLRDDGHQPWVDEQLWAGDKWWDNICSEIRDCEIFVAALTPDFVESQECQKELNYAQDLKKTLLPVQLSDQILPRSLPPVFRDFGERHWLDYRRRDKEAYKELQRNLKNLAKSPPLPNPLPGAPAAPPKRIIFDKIFGLYFLWPTVVFFISLILVSVCVLSVFYFESEPHVNHGAAIFSFLLSVIFALFTVINFRRSKKIRVFFDFFRATVRPTVRRTVSTVFGAFLIVVSLVTLLLLLWYKFDTTLTVFIVVSLGSLFLWFLFWKKFE